MSYKEKASGEGYRGGRVDPEADAPKPRPRFPCFATGCPMPGTIFPGAGVGGTGDRPGECAWHYGVQPTDIPRVTQVLQDWLCVAREVNAARRAQYGEAASSPRALDALFEQAVQRLRPHVQAGGWGDQFERQPGEDYRRWGQRLEAFIGGRVVEVLSTYRPQPRVAASAAIDEDLPWQ